MSFSKKKCICFVLILLFSIIFAPLSRAASSSVAPGNGDGQGQNADIALTLVSSSVADGATNVPVNPVIQLNFNKNVVNIAVMENNSKCFHLTDENGAPVPIRIIFPDDQTQSEFKRNVFIIPQEKLKINSKYELAVDSKLCAKNNTNIDSAHVITFEAGAAAAGEQNKALLKLGNDITVYNTALKKTEYSVPHKKEVQNIDKTRQPAENKVLDIDKLSSILLFVIAAVFVCSSLFFILQKRKGKNQ
ncbi:MAG: Ig-like domain-containing protein [Syntrophomonas sp.]